MAVTGILQVSSTYVIGTQNIHCAMVLTNSAGGTAVSILSIQPYLLSSNGLPQVGAIGPIPAVVSASQLLGAAAGANTSLSLPFEAVIYDRPAPQNPPYPNSPAYDLVTIGAEAYMSDGTVVNASVTVFCYPLIKDNTIAVTAFPGPGKSSFDANTNSGLFVALAAPLFAVNSSVLTPVFSVN